MNIRGVPVFGWNSLELGLLERALSPIPDKWLKHNRLLSGIAREPELLNAPPDAPGNSKYNRDNGSIVVFDKGVYDDRGFNWNQFRRSIYHELAHTLIDNDPTLIQRWLQETDGDDFVDEYAKTSPDEDFADSFSEFLIHQDKMKELVPRKWEFIDSMTRSERMEKEAMTNFMNGFVDEMSKTAGLKSLVARLGSKGAKGAKGAASAAGRSSKPRVPGKVGIGKALLLAGGGTAAGATVAGKKGKKKGYEEGTSDVMSVAERARSIGRREGVMAYHNALLARQKGG